MRMHTFLDRARASLMAAIRVSSTAILLAFALPQLAARAEEDEANAALKFEAWSQQLDEADRLYGTRIQKLTDYIEENFAVEEARAFSIVSTAVEHGTRNGINPELLLAVIAVESTFRHDAVSPKGARGLMQILPRAHPEAIRAIGGVHALFEPEHNIKTGTQILVDYLEASDGDLNRALARYNGSSPRKSAYARKVMSLYRAMQGVT